MKIRVTFKLRTVIEADSLPQALKLAQDALTLPPHLFDIQGEAAVCRSKPKWWTASIIPAQQFLDRIRKFIDDNYFEKS